MHKIIVAGCGMMSGTWIKHAKNREDSQIVALVDIIPERAEAQKKEYALSANTYASITEALEKEDATIVFDITVPSAHYDVVTTSLRAGCHVFGEKPMSDSLEKSEKMVECANETKKEYFVMKNRRYIPQLYALRNFLHAKTLGKIGQVSANFQLDPHFGGFREEMDSPLIADMAIHTFDACRFLTGKNAVSVYCHEFNPFWSWYQGNASAICVFEMEDGSVFDYRGSWCANGLNTSWESEWRIACENGAVFWDGAEKLYYDATADGAAKTGISDENEITSSFREIAPMPMANTYHDACINEMFAALQSGTRPQTDCRDNIHSIRMVYKAIESAKTKKTVLF